MANVTNEQINEYFHSIDGSVDCPLECFDENGKVVPYVGWYWREVNFDKPFSLYVPARDGGPDWYGFMQNNKWDYTECQPSADDCLLIRVAAARLTVERTDEAAKALYDTIQEVGRRSPVLTYED